MFETRQQNLAARARRLKARLDDIQSSANGHNRDLTWHERHEVDRCRDEARELQKKAQDIRADEEMDNIMTDLGKGIHQGKSPSPKESGAPFAFKESDFKTLHDAARRRVPMKLISRTESPMSFEREYFHPPFGFMRDTFRLLDHLPTLQTTNGRIAYFSATAAATGAAPVAEGALKPESNPTWTETEALVQKVAHYAKASDEVLSDFNDFMGLVSEELIRGLVHAETGQLLNGNGTPPNLLGLLNGSGILTRARGTDSNLDALLKASTDLRVGSSFTDPNLVIMTPENFQTIRLAKDGQGNYLLGNPLSPDVPKLGNATIHLTSRMPANTALVLNSSESVRVWVREAPSISSGLVDDDLITNKVALVAEERLAQAVVRPTAICKVTGLN
jgi:hypothetical protein